MRNVQGKIEFEDNSKSNRDRNWIFKIPEVGMNILEKKRTFGSLEADMSLSSFLEIFSNI